jgi:hypothetical protein
MPKTWKRPACSKTLLESVARRRTATAGRSGHSGQLPEQGNKLRLAIFNGGHDFFCITFFCENTGNIAVARKQNRSLDEGLFMKTLQFHYNLERLSSMSPPRQLIWQTGY